jgi:hypothetical protein
LLLLIPAAQRQPGPQPLPADSRWPSRSTNEAVIVGSQRRGVWDEELKTRGMKMGHRAAAEIALKAPLASAAGESSSVRDCSLPAWRSPLSPARTVPAPGSLDGVFALVAENDRPLPSAHGEPSGCCLTLSGSITFRGAGYELRTSHRNKNNGITFDNSEQGTFTRQGNTLIFTRTGGAAEGFPYLLGPGTVSADQQAVTLLYGDEGPGSDQIRALFRC